MSKERFTTAVLVPIVAVLAAFAIACGGGDDDDDGQAASGDGGGVQEVRIASTDLAFTPTTLRVNARQPVKLVLDNSEGAVLHDWTVEEVHVSNVHTEGGAEHAMDGDHMDDEDMAMDDDEEMHMDDDEMGMDGFSLHIAADTKTMAIIEFTPEEPGEYTFYCTVEGHRQAGMEGTLIVE